MIAPSLGQFHVVCVSSVMTGPSFEDRPANSTADASRPPSDSRPVGDPPGVLEVLDEYRVLRWATEDASACLPFVAAAPLRRRAFSRNYDERTRGESYKAEWYEAIVGAAFRQVAANAALAAATTEKALAPAMVARCASHPSVRAQRPVRSQGPIS
jgi:hypothetical protein